VRAAVRPEDEPTAPGPDVVFLGRSNVGKSSLINRMLGTKNLARTSSQPGRTQSVNFYRINESCHFVDLPGYGWARVPEAVRRAWKPMVESYLDRRRERLAMAVLVVDSRHEAAELDLTMFRWLKAKEIPHVVGATKSDKLGSNQRARAERSLLAGFGEAGAAGRPLLISGHTGAGIRELWRYVDGALETWRSNQRVRSGAGRPAPE